MPLTSSAVAADTFKAGYFTALELIIPPAIDCFGAAGPAVALPLLPLIPLVPAVHESVVPDNVHPASRYRVLTSVCKALPDS